MSEAIWAIVVAGGEGRRYGAAKQFADLNGHPVWQWAVTSARTVAGHVVLVVPAARVTDAGFEGHVDAVVAGGPTRSASVRAGLALVPNDAEVILVHDAARPLASVALFEAVVNAVLAGADAVVPGLPVSDTVKRVNAGLVEETLRRDGLVGVQTPQGFRAAVLRTAHVGDPESTDDSALVEALGGRVQVVPGEEANTKITSPDDLDLAAWRLGVASMEKD